MIRIKTSALKRAVSKAMKGASMDKNLPLTNMIGISCYRDTLNVRTTDGINWLCMIEKVDCPTVDFEATVPAEIFSKLIAKITAYDIELSLEGTTLVVKGNGTYKIELPIDQGGLVEFPNPINSIKDRILEKEVKASNIKAVLNSNKPSLAKNLTIPCLCGYYVDTERVVSTDESIACFSPMNLLDDVKLLPSTLIDLLALTDCDTFKYSVVKTDKGLDNLLFETDDMWLFGAELGFREQYPIQPLVDMVSSRIYDGQCKVSKLLLSGVLDRLYLFVDQYDANSVTFTFTETGLNISSRKMSGIETINYIDRKEFTPFVAIVDVISLKAILSSFNGEEVTIYYGDESAIKLESENATYIMALSTAVN